MRALLSPQLFPEARRSRLGVLCEHGLEGRHRLQVTDEAHSDFREWMGSLDDKSRSEWHTALDSGARTDGMEPSAYEIEIVQGNHSSWDLPRPKLTLQDALVLLDEKFTIILEGDAEDRDFLERMSTPEQDRTLRKFEECRGLQIVLGGGLSSMLKKAKRDAAEPGARLRRWYLFDSDGLRPGEESTQSKLLREQCEAAGHRQVRKPGRAKLPHLQLRRRMIENYLPYNALREWVHELPPRTRQGRKRLFDAFRNLGAFEGSTVPRQHHFNMKTGLKRGRDAQVKGEIFGDLTEEVTRALHDGFGEDIAKLFKSTVRREDLRKDGGWSEVNPQIGQLIALIR